MPCLVCPSSLSLTFTLGGRCRLVTHGGGGGTQFISNSIVQPPQTDDSDSAKLTQGLVK